MSGYHFTPKAAADLESIQDYIARDRPGASLAWVQLLEQRCIRLAENPGWGRPPKIFARACEASRLGAICFSTDKPAAA